MQCQRTGISPVRNLFLAPVYAGVRALYPPGEVELGEIDYGAHEVAGAGGEVSLKGAAFFEFANTVAGAIFVSYCP